MAKRRVSPSPSPIDDPELLAIVPLQPTGALAAGLLGLVGTGTPLIHVARDELRLRAIASLLAAFAPDLGVAVYPAWDCLPYDRTSPTPAVMGARAGVLRWLTDAAALPAIVLTTAPALIQRVPPPETWRDAHVEIRPGDPFDADALAGVLGRLGYAVDERVDEPGEMAPHGHTFDVYPAAATRPCRIEHEAGRVTAIRSYDPVSQRSLAPSDRLVIDPATEMVGAAADGLDLARRNSGAEHRLAQFYPALATVFDYVPGARLSVTEGVDERADAFFEQIAEGRAEAGRAAGPESALYLTRDEWRTALDRRQVASARRDPDENGAVPVFAREARPTSAFAAFLAGRVEAGDRVVLAGPEAALGRMLRQAEAAGIGEVTPAAGWASALLEAPGAVLSLAAPLDRGFALDGVTAIAAADLLGERAGLGRAPATSFEMGDVELQVGDVAVDRDHGLCVLEGLERITLPDGGTREALRLRFAHDDTLMVPVRQADRIWRYGSEPDAVRLDRVDGESWKKRRLEVEAQIARTARAMVEKARERDGARAEPIEPPAREMERFAAGFGFTLTPDQAAAIDGVIADLASGRPMDRLVCGDVGFGKTEVALRAAAAALFAGRQVAVVAPTTVLARQHVDTFRRRFARFGIEAAQLSRLATPAEAKRVKAGLADGSVRLVIGTQAVAGQGVRFADLGLTIIDEEQRFGAKLKDRLHALGGEHGHVLTLSATPIPRTLQFALAGLQAMSIIATPPAVRQPIRTAVAPFDEDDVRALLLREKARNGQSFVVCPRIEEIEPVAARLSDLVPGLTVLTAHGDMKPGDIDDRMVAFANGDGDVLLATTIIESGLDVPRANTMLIWDAGRFGLSQLHQLRGRVGRGQRRGIIHLVVDPDHPLSRTAEKRLRTLEALDRLGAGFAISASDLDLRGAGELVGEEQTGHVERIGLGLYQHLLQLALREAKGEPAEDWTPALKLGLAGDIPEEYVPEPDARLGLYLRALRLQGRDEIAALRDEVVDRFGQMPPSVDALFTAADLRLACRDLGIEQLTGGPQGIAADVRAGSPVADASLPDLATKGRRVVLKQGSDDPAERGRLAARLLDRLADACRT